MRALGGERQRGVDVAGAATWDCGDGDEAPRGGQGGGPVYTRCAGANPAGMCRNVRAAEISPHGAEAEPRVVSIPHCMKVVFLHQRLENQSYSGRVNLEPVRFSV